MPSGGARARSGPPPDPNALRRELDGDSWVKLPASGREGDPPEWPLSHANDREKTLWDAEWRRPQAIMWERNSQEVEVAMYVRSLVVAEAPDATTVSRTLLRQQQEALGLSIPGLHRNKWKIGDAPADATAHVAAAPSASARDRFKVVPGGKRR